MVDEDPLPAFTLKGKGNPFGIPAGEETVAIASEEFFDRFDAHQIQPVNS
ncbi:hypothetical protein HRbin17_02430 [bacterium HR17]|uniref:Uncharacterized protein n=1 Tax=Candidatus Fervidibacter japonicus TaxID=2035412 RepID=A0A2H5XFD9_9BACT|nr:hypothetical protein HRbin17_02430 [bacterium HR17]